MRRTTHVSEDVRGSRVRARRAPESEALSRRKGADGRVPEIGTQLAPIAERKGEGRLRGDPDREPPRDISDPREQERRILRLPAGPLHGFLVHPPNSFDPSDNWESGFSDDVWEAVRWLLERGQALAVPANEEEVLHLTIEISMRMPFRTTFSYDPRQEMLWLKT